MVLLLLITFGRCFPDPSRCFASSIFTKTFLRLRKHFATAEAWDDFFGKWHQICSTASQGEFNNQWQQMQATYPAATAAYMNTTWLPHKEKIIKACCLAHAKFKPNYNFSRQGSRDTKADSQFQLSTIYIKRMLYYTQQKSQLC